MKTRSLIAAALASASVVPFLWAERSNSAARSESAHARAEAVDYQRDVRPILSANCFACHGPDEAGREAELRLDQRDSAVSLRDDDYQVIVPGDAEASELIFRVTDELDPMPPTKTGHTLTGEQIEILRRWINEGAEYAPHWAFEPIVKPDSTLDEFVAARLAEAGLERADEADKHTLIRRLSLDLIGLPPTQEEVSAFLADDKPGAYERLVDRLLASPHYGERWAAVWLDLARYADSKGHGSDPLREIWRWRDWVIEAYNADMPFDRFTLEQMAGDMLPDTSMDTRLATAFHRNSLVNTEGGTDDEEFRVAAVKDRTNLSMQVWMGLTFGCAECHTHKFDPITHEDYYSTFAIFNQTADADANDDSPKIATPTRAQQSELAKIEQRLADLSLQIESTPIDEAAFAAWQQQQAESASQWVNFDDREFPLFGEVVAPYTFADGVWSLREGHTEATATAKYSTAADQPVRALRLVALANPELPNGGPGVGAGNGNFVVSEIEARHSPARWGDANARIVRITLPGEERFLSLAEVEVLAAGQSVVGGAVARQSSTAFDGPAELAIDGVTDGEYQAGSVTHSAREQSPWWEVELAEGQLIEEIRIWFRTDGELYKRSDKLQVEVFAADRTPIAQHWVETVSAEPSIWQLKNGGVLRLTNAQASFAQDDWGASKAIDGMTSTGWAIAPRQGEQHEWRCEVQEAHAPGAVIVQMSQLYGAGHLLGSFRLQRGASSLQAQMLPSTVQATLALAAEDRSAEQQLELENYFRRFDPGVRALETERIAVSEARAGMRVPQTPVLVALDAGMQRQSFIFDKGSFLNPLDEVQARVPTAFNWADGEVGDRAEFARWLTHPDNPLTPRVTVNRIWSQLFGRGIVLTEEDFGAQGALPTHPDLLDWLAAEYKSHWSQKRLLKTIVMSKTYRQSSKVTAQKLEVDPSNVLYSRGARFRLPAEAVRDQALSASGLLSRKMYGPSVFPPQPDGLWQAAFNGERTWQTDTDEDRWRRGVYVFWRRSTPYPSMMVFDAPSRELCTIRRIRTNTPLQAFVTLNDPVYVEAAQALARRMLAQRFQSMQGAEDRARIRMGLEWTLIRPADPRAVELLEELLNEQREIYRDRIDEARALASEPLGMLPDDADPAEYAAWTVLANVLLNQDAFLTRD